jgi:tRNA(fMet)-specific endonuclease VapC
LPLQYLLDTGICIYGRGLQPKVVARLERVDEGDAAISVVTYGELLFGCAKSPDPQQALLRLNLFLDRVPALALPPEAASVYGWTRNLLERQGKTIGPNDLWIAAHAIASGLTLVTNNEREFRRIDGLKIENWAK